MKAKFVGLLVVAIMMAISLFAEAKIIRVPADYPTIQEGIDAAEHMDTVLVADGTYTGDCNKNLDFKGKAITVRSENGPESTIIDCEGSGRGFYFHSGETIASSVKGFTIKNGDSSGICCEYSAPLIENNIITNNSTTSSGGGICCWGSPSPTIQNNDIMRNVARDGGGIYCTGSSATIKNNNITGNVALSGGGINCQAYSSPNITNNAITRNEANYGGGISVTYYSAPSIINSTIARNLAQYGGGIYCVDSSSPTVLNTILYFDTAYASGNEISLSGSIITITYSDVAGGWEGEGNIDEDPIFDGFNDYHLQAGSPCIDAGTPDGAPPDDIEGNPRDEKPDMGAYEYQGDKLGAINGTVTDKVTGTPITKALVIAVQKSTKEKTITNRDGNYEIRYLQPGDWWAIVIKEGYKAGIAKVVVEAGKTTRHDFPLEPK